MTEDTDFPEQRVAIAAAEAEVGKAAQAVTEARAVFATKQRALVELDEALNRGGLEGDLESLAKARAVAQGELDAVQRALQGRQKRLEGALECARAADRDLAQRQFPAALERLRANDRAVLDRFTAAGREFVREAMTLRRTERAAVREIARRVAESGPIPLPALKATDAVASGGFEAVLEVVEKALRAEVFDLQRAAQASVPAPPPVFATLPEAPPAPQLRREVRVGRSWAPPPPQTSAVMEAAEEVSHD